MHKPSKKGDEVFQVLLRATPIPAETGAAGAKYIQDDVRENGPWLENATCWYDEKSHALFFRAEDFLDQSGILMRENFENFVLGFFGNGDWMVDIESVKKIRRE